MIETYLRELDCRLHVPRRLRVRILAETRDHLLELVESGMSEEDAVRAFGAPEPLARDFHEQLAAASAHRASALSGAMLLLLGALVAATPDSSPFTIVAFFGGQVALVSGVLALARSLRYRAQGAVPPSALPDMYRANAVTLACVATILLSFVVRLALRSDLSAGLGILAVAVGAAALAAAVALARSLARARVLAGGEPESDAFDDLLALAPRPFERRALPIANWIRRHPWPFCALFSAACGLALGIGHVVTDGGSGIHPARTALAVLVLAATEASAVVLGYLALGGVLGIRRARV